MTKDAIFRRVRELAAERGGHISFDAFLNETGIKDKWLRSQEWFEGWNNLLSKLGLETRSFGTVRTPPSKIAEAVAILIEREGRWPTEDDFRRERKKNSAFPSLGVISPLRRSGELAILIVNLGASNAHFVKAATIAMKFQPNEKNGETVSTERVLGYVYLLRSGRRYKIGKTNDPLRRFREVRLELPEETHQVHTIPTDDPTGIEAYWHGRFSNKRVRNTEFFELDGTDVQAFKRRKYQ